jgi:hypothetical protein
MSKFSPDKLLIFHLSGGPIGPRSIQGNVVDDPKSAAHALWVSTRMGTVGRQFDWRDDQLRPHCYKVIDKREETDAIIVTCEHMTQC